MTLQPRKAMCPYLMLGSPDFKGCAMQTLWQDLRYAIRMLKKIRGFTAVALPTLALGIGANAVVFSVLNALIIHPLHVPDAESLYGIQHGNEASSSQSYPDYLDLRDRNRSFDGLAAYDAAQVGRSEEHTSELQSHHDLVCRLLLEKKKQARRRKHT